jgi:peptide/nickel transport system ATP-binding protein
VSPSTAAGRVHAVRGLSFDIAPGETLAVVGESGCGKSVAMLSLLGLATGARVSGLALFEGRNLLCAEPRELRAVRGARVGMIFQNPLTSLHPFYRIGAQIAEAIQAHEPVSRSVARRRAMELLQLVGIAGAERRVDDYPHEFSGGMLQRVMIAMAIALSPRLLTADEPTTALDVTMWRSIS